MKNQEMEKDLAKKYKSILEKKKKAQEKGNYAMADVYNQKAKTIRTTLGMLRINIAGINC